MSFFDFFSDGGGASPIIPSPIRRKIVPVHVIDIILDEDHLDYETIADIGKIKYRDLENGLPFSPKVEAGLTTYAFPMDRSITRFPIPGEQVMIFEAFGDQLKPNGSALAKIAYYTFTVPTTHNITSNSSPFLLSNVDTIEYNRRVNKTTASKRFEKKWKDKKSFKEGDDIKIYPQLRPYEGDFILQGRFGNSIRFGSTSEKEKKGEVKPWKSVGASGDPILTFRINRESVTERDSMYTKEDWEKDDVSMYFCSSQNIEITLQTPPRLKTWENIYNVKTGITPSVSKLDEGLYSKVIDTTVDPHKELEDPKDPS